MSLRGRQDMKLDAVFLTSRVKDSTIEDYDKLRRLLSCFVNTMCLTTFVGVDNLHTLETPVDMSCTPHDDFKSHTGSASPCGTGLISSKYSKQNLNTTSSIKTELVGVADYLPKALSHNLLMGTRGYSVNNNQILQDSKSAIMLETNGRKSYTKRSKHFNIRCFCMKDLVDKNQDEIDCCATENLLVDFFTNPL